MVRGPEWGYVDELVAGKTTSQVRCKSCGHTFHGNATRIKEHLFNITGNVGGCSTPPTDLHVHLHKYVVKMKGRSSQMKKKPPSIYRGTCSTQEGPIDVNEGIHGGESIIMENGQSSQGQTSRVMPSASLHFDKEESSLRKEKNQTLYSAFDKQSMLELHLKWTQAFMACGISFNVIRNPIFQDALMCTAKKGFVLPDYNKMRTEYVDKVKASTEAILKRTVLDFVPLFGCTIALDGWTNCQKKPLINIMCICPKGSVFLEAVDTSLKEKTAVYLTKVYERAIAKVGGPSNVTAIVTDNASNYKGAGLTIQEKYPEITWVPCAAHTLNLLLKDIGKMSFVKQTLLDANHVVKFIREHQFTYALFRSKSPNKVLQIFCATRFATAYYVLDGLVKVRPALNETVADRRWDLWVDKYPSYSAAALKCTQLVQSVVFWRNLEKIIGVSKPFVDLLRVVDTEKFVFGRVYWLMSEAIRQMKEYNHFSSREKGQLVAVANARWRQMHTPLHGAAFALDPKFQMYSQPANSEVMGNFKKVCLQMLPGDEGKEAFHQRVKFANRMGLFGDPWHLDAIKRVSAPIWWKEYGGETVELQHVATRVLSVAASSGSCERNWSAFDFVHTKRRNRLNPSRAADLVYVFCNMRLLHAPTCIAKRATEQSFAIFQTHEALVEERGSDDDMEWEVASECSDVNEVDDMVPVLVDDTIQALINPII